MTVSILLVEDKPDWQQIIKRKLLTAFKEIEISDPEIKTVNTYNEGERLLHSRPWNLLITDIGLGDSPFQSQQKLGIHLIEFAYEQQIPAIVVSGTPLVDNQDVSDFYLEKHLSAFFSKRPFKSDKFIKKVQEILQEKNSTKIDEFQRRDVINALQSHNETITNKSQQKSFQTQSPELLIDFAIITAIEIERKAVCKAFKLTEQNRVKKESRVYWRGRLNLQDGKFYEIVVAQSPDMANVDAALITSDTIHHWHPASMLMVGIAGAASEEEKLGDLILGSSIYYYERGKEKTKGNKPEPYMYPSDATLWSRVMTLPEWKARIYAKRPDGSGERPNIYQGVIASGERVIADAAIRNEIAAGQRKIKAIEMEGYGFSKAAWQNFNPVRHLVIRAICDRADSSKSSEWHPYATAVAAGFTKHFLLDQPLDPRN